jgi:ribosomal protein S18 acetylase RimI-like enzyme
MRDCGDIEAQALVTSLTSRDFASVAALVAELARYHGDEYAPAASALERDYGTWYEARLARNAVAKDVGFVTWQRSYVPQCAERGMEIRNLFVREDFRSRGVGRELLRAAARAALTADCQRLRLCVRKDNAVGVQFYKRLGCTTSDAGMTWGCRWDGNGILDLTK